MIHDGTNDNLGYNFGVEGPTQDAAVLDGRFQARRNLMATLMLSHGVPMMLGGDELCQTQEGNNNAYCQDNTISWLDWALNGREQEFLAFTRHLISIRNTFASLRPSKYAESEIPAVPHEPGMVSWHDADGSELMPGAWSRQAPRVLMLTIEPNPRMSKDGKNTLLMLINASENEMTYKVPKLPHRRRCEWTAVLDTARSDGKTNAIMRSGEEVGVQRCSILVAVAR